MYTKIGFIGSGNMASAIIGGAVKSGFIISENIYISDVHKIKAQQVAKLYGVKVLENNLELVENSEVLILSVKPQVYKIVLDEIKQFIKKDTLIVTIAAGISISYVKSFFNSDIKVIRTMPNTPALVGEGMTGITYAPPVEKDDIEFVKSIFSSFGIVEIIDESLMDTFTSLCSSSPAFVAMFIEAMADAGVFLGLSRDKSYIMAAQAVRGAAKMIIETGMHPGELKDMVCSPGGTAIEGVRSLEASGMRSSIMEAIIVTAEKAKKLNSKYK